jgi:hypothetical protein
LYLVMAERIGEADAFYAALQRGIADPERRLVQRQALAGMLWFKQFYYFDVRNWLAGDPGRTPPPPLRRQGRNAEWTHLNNYAMPSGVSSSRSWTTRRRCTLISRRPGGPMRPRH